MAQIIAEMPQQPDEEEIFQAMEGLIYNLNTMHKRAGAQVPFSTLNLGTDTSKMGRAITWAVYAPLKDWAEAKVYFPQFSI